MENFKMYDISQELFSAEVYPGDPVPGKEMVLSLEKENPDICQLTKLTMGSHAGTHMDAPCHFIAGGKDAGQIELEKCAGKCLVVDTEKICEDDLKQWEQQCVKRLLLKNQKKLSEEEALALTNAGIVCVGVECSTVGCADDNVNVHRILLANEVAVVEGLRLDHVPVGEYFLLALPLKMEGLDGSPVRAVLLTCEKGEEEDGTA